MEHLHNLSIMHCRLHLHSQPPFPRSLFQSIPDGPTLSAPELVAIANATSVQGHIDEPLLDLLDDRRCQGVRPLTECPGNVPHLPRDPLLRPTRRHARAPQTGPDDPDEQEAERNKQSISDAKAHDRSSRFQVPS